MMRNRLFFVVMATVALVSWAGTAHAEFAYDTISGMSLWLQADAGTTLDGGYVADWADQSGKGNDATALDSGQRPLLATATIGGESHDVLRFDGTNDALTLGTSLTDMPRQDHTAFFVTARTGGTTTSTGNLFGFDRTGGRTNDGWYYKFTEGAVNMEAGHGSDYAYQLAGPQGNDQFILGEGRYNSTTTTAELWIDGLLKTSTDSVVAPINTPTYTRLNIGAFDLPTGDVPATGYTNFFRGDIAEILVFDHALSDTDQAVVRSYLADKYGLEVEVPRNPIPLDMRAYWTFDVDGTDSVGGNDLTLNGGATIVPGRLGQGLDVTNSASDGYALAAASEDLDVDYQFSMAMWLKYDENNEQYARVIARNQDADNGVNLAFQSGDQDSSQVHIRIRYDGVNYFATSDDAVLTRDEYHHLAFSFDDLALGDAAAKITLWIDGTEVDVTDSSTAGSVQGDASFCVGRGTSTTADYSGIVDDLRFYRGVLEQGDIDALQVPEPSSLMLLLGASLATLFLRKRTSC